MKIEIEVSELNECTAAPWWMIVDPRQNMGCSAHLAASQITGPFFSRESAEAFLKRASHHYTKRAVVYCASGRDSGQYATALRDARERKATP